MNKWPNVGTTGRSQGGSRKHTTQKPRIAKQNNIKVQALKEAEAQRQDADRLTGLFDPFNASLIAWKKEQSFASFRHDNSLQTIDLMLRQVNEADTQGDEPDYSVLYGQYQRLIGKFTSHSPERQNQTDSLEEAQSLLRLQNSQTEGGSSSELAEEDVQVSTAGIPAQMQEIFLEKESQINISKIMNKDSQADNEGQPRKIKTGLKEAEDDDVVAMLKNELHDHKFPPIEEDELLVHSSESENILRQLDEYEEFFSTAVALLAKRSKWVRKNDERSERWRSSELKFISRIQQVLRNPYVEFSSEEQEEELNV